MTKNHTSALDISALTEKEENSKVSINRFQFLFENPFLLQDFLSREKLIPPDQLEIDWVLHPDKSVAQTVSLIRLQRSYLAARFHVRITSEFRVLAMPPNQVFPYNSFNSLNLNDLSDSDAIPQVVDEFLTLSEDRYMILLHHTESTWEMIGCLSPMPFIKPEVIDLSFDDEEVPSLHKETSSMMHHTVWTNPDLAHVPYMVDPVFPNYEAHQSVTAAPRFEMPRFELASCNIKESVSSEKQPLFQCSVCQRIMSSKAYFNAHVRTHDPKNVLKCPASTCSYVAYRKDHMNRHVEAHHPALIEVPIYICPTCPKKFRTVSFYEGHIKICSGIRMLSCPSCDYVTKKRSILTIHLRKKHSLLGNLISDRSHTITPPTD